MQINWLSKILFYTGREHTEFLLRHEVTYG